jgi:alpha-beta hydrolase superfamily lysophospholipase
VSIRKPAQSGLSFVWIYGRTRLPNEISHSPEQFAKANGIELCYDTFGDRNALPLLLIMGLGAHMILWDDVFCSALAERGFFVIRFDNRDIGNLRRSTGRRRLRRNSWKMH